MKILWLLIVRSFSRLGCDHRHGRRDDARPWVEAGWVAHDPAHPSADFVQIGCRAPDSTSPAETESAETESAEPSMTDSVR